MTSFEKSKPAVFCRLKNIITGEQFIVGSIHHPGGNHDLRNYIKDCAIKLQGRGNDMPHFIAGDYNHTPEQFKQLDINYTGTPIYFPHVKGTMSGSDYSNTNKAIDGIMSNKDLKDSVKVSSSISLVAPCRNAY